VVAFGAQAATGSTTECNYRGVVVKTVEERILEVVWEVLTRRVNFYLGEMDAVVPFLEREGGGVYGRFGVRPVVALDDCESSEKERVLLVDAYTVSVDIKAPERDCWFYTHALRCALREDLTLNGIAAEVKFKRTTYKDGVCFGLKVIVEQLAISD
jgi:hypothetical protein